MNIVSSFTNNGIPATGLTPTIRIRNVVGGSLLVTDENMTEIGDGWYSYDFITYDSLLDYAIRCDAGNTLANDERYTFTGNESFREDIQKGLAKDSDLKRALGLLHENILIDEPVYDNDNNLKQARVRIYSVGTSVGTTNDILATYVLNAAGSGHGKFTTWKQVKQ